MSRGDGSIGCVLHKNSTWIIYVDFHKYPIHDQLFHHMHQYDTDVPSILSYNYLEFNKSKN
jgi:hypothetical protein